MRIGVKPGQWGWTFDELAGSWRAAEEAGFDILSCFDHVSAAPAGLAAWNAPSLLTAMAGVTDRIGLAVDVLNVSLRHPFLLAGQLAVAQVIRDSGGFAQLAGQAERLCGPRTSPLRKAAQVFVRDISLADARQLVADLEQAGAESVIFVLVEEHDPRAVRELAAAVL